MTNTPQNAPGPDYGQGSKYGTAAYNPQQSFEQGRPAKVATLHKMTIASLVIWLLSIISGIIMSLSPEFEEQMRQAYIDGGMGEEMAAQAAEAAGTFGIITTVVMAIVALIPYILVLIGVPKGKNWARILGIVFAIIAVLFTIYGLATSGMSLQIGGAMSIVGLILNVLFLVVNIYWLVLAFNGRVADWFKAAR